MLTVILSLLVTPSAQSAPVQVSIQPLGYDDETTQVMRNLILDSPEVQTRLGGVRYRILETQLGQSQPAKEQNLTEEQNAQQYQIKVFDYEHNQLLNISGSLGDRGSKARIVISGDKISPSPEEIEDAVAVIRQDRYFGAPERKDLWTHYAAMPGLIEADRLTLAPVADRVIAIGLLPKEAEACQDTGNCRLDTAAFRHEIVGVNLSRGTVIRYRDHAPPTAIATSMACAPPSARQYVTGRGTQGQAQINVDRDGQRIWQFTAIRPSASSGSRGSGIDLRNVYFKGKRVLSQIHLPILNVQYDRNICGPYRDWQYSESYIQARGTAITSGILRASEAPKTIFESGSDYGTYRGVAVYTEGTETILVAELEAGWYRYKNEYRFREDGTIQPRWGFSAIQDSCTCYSHHHHAYWRMDFDVGTSAANTVQYYDGVKWNNVTTESNHRRDTTHRMWRFLAADGSGYQITPGDDGTADTYGKGDAWVVRYAQNQLDDNYYWTGTSANISAFMNQQATVGQDNVFWYAAHYKHSHDGTGLDRGVIIGPTLTPVGW